MERAATAGRAAGHLACRGNSFLHTVWYGFCGQCGKMLDAVNLLTTFTLLGTSAFLARNAAKNSTPNTTKKRQSLLTPACPSTKKKKATVHCGSTSSPMPSLPSYFCECRWSGKSHERPQGHQSKTTADDSSVFPGRSRARELSVHRREAGDKNTNKIVAVLPVHVDFIQIR